MRAPFSRTLFDLLREISERAGDQFAVVSKSDHRSYSQLLDSASRVARLLSDFGVRRGDRVGLLSPNRIEWLEICFGAHAIGAVLVPFSTWSKEAELRHLLADSGVKVLFAVDKFLGHDFVSALRHIQERTDVTPITLPERIVYLSEAGVEGEANYGELMMSAAPNDLGPPGETASALDDAFILYSSGSSARPKAVRLRHHAVVENAFNIGERQGLRPSDKVFLSAPLFWIYGAGNALPATFTHEATLVIQDHFEPAGALDLIEQYKCTSIYTLPANTNALTSHPTFRRERTRSLRTGMTIGSPKDIATAANVLGVAGICNIYGSTETGGNCCVTQFNAPLQDRINNQGRPLPGVIIRIVDPETGASLPLGGVGEVEVYGFNTPGYFGSSAQHNKALFTHDKYVRTGDTGYLDRDGFFHFVSRNSEIIKRNGINISPLEVEEVLAEHPAIAQAFVVAVPDDTHGELIVAFIVNGRGETLTADSLNAYCRDRLSSYKIPDHFLFDLAIPVTETGKTHRREMKERALQFINSARVSP